MTIFNEKEISTPKDEVLCAKIDAYSSIKELEKNSDIIVAGLKTEEQEPTFLYDGSGEYLLCAYTLSNFNVCEILGGMEKKDIENKNIKILENEFYDKEENVNYHIAGYNKMITGKSYILYLKYSENNDWYVPTGVVTGKIPVDDTEQILTVGKDSSLVDNVENIVKKVHKKYDFNRIARKCREKKINESQGGIK